MQFRCNRLFFGFSGTSLTLNRYMPNLAHIDELRRHCGGSRNTTVCVSFRFPPHSFAMMITFVDELHILEDTYHSEPVIFGSHVDVLGWSSANYRKVSNSSLADVHSHSCGKCCCFSFSFIHLPLAMMTFELLLIAL